MNPLLLVLLAAQAATAPPSGTVPPAPNCAALDQGLPADVAGWNNSGERLVPGHAVMLRATTADNPPGARPGLGATIAFSVPMDGIYGVALDQAGSIDVLPVMDRGPGTTLTPVGREQALPCSSIHTIMLYRLNAATYYSLSLGGLASPTARVMLVAPPSPRPPAQ